MQFLANENIPSKSISILRNAGYDVIAIGEESPGISDRDILNRAQIEHRIILTFDRDYGELIYKRWKPSSSGWPTRSMRTDMQKMQPKWWTR